MGPYIHDHCTDHAHQQAGGQAHERGRGEGAHDVFEQAAYAGCEDRFFPLFSVISLDDAHTAQRFGEAASDLGVDFSALAEDWANRTEGFIQRDREAQ